MKKVWERRSRAFPPHHTPGYHDTVYATIFRAWCLLLTWRSLC